MEIKRDNITKELLMFIEEQIFALENRLKECENGCEGTVFLDRCKLHDAEEKVRELTQANEQLSESYDHLEKTKDELLSERAKLTEENERLREHNVALEQKLIILGCDEQYVFKAKVKG